MISCGKLGLWINGLNPVILMVLVQISFALVNILYKIAAEDGMSLRILIAYRLLFASAFIVPLALFIERGSLVQNVYLESIVLTSATFASVMFNLVPGFTFILGVLFRLEKISIKTLPGKAKILGTLNGIGGAMVLTFYKGIEIKTFSVHTHILKSHAHETTHSARETLLGSFTAIIGCCSYALWLIVQAKMSARYPCYYSSTALLNLMAAIQSFVFALIVERDFSQWKLGWNIRLVAASFTGVVASGIMISLIAWCIRLRGPLLRPSQSNIFCSGFTNRTKSMEWR